MATCKQTAYELIQDVFSPCIAVLCSSDVEQICAKNNLTFVQMVQPFCRLNTEVTIRDPNNVPCTIKNFKFNMKHLHSQPPSPTAGKKMMHDAVASNITSATDGVLMNTLSTDNYFLKYSPSTPWFEAYREVFFQVTSSPEHEFVHNYLSCIFVVSSSHQDPLSQINELSQQLTQHQNTHSSRWFFSYVFTYYLLLHDVSSDDLGKAEAVYQSMKSSFGATSCHLLQINSIPESAQTSNNSKDSNDTVMADPWSQFLPKYYVQNNISNNQALEENSVDVTDENKTGDSTSKCMQESGSIHHPLLYNSDTDVMNSDSLLGNSHEDISGYTNKLSKSNCKMKRHGLCLTQSDMDRIKCFVQDYCIQGLIPFIEKRVRLLNEQVANRKGLHRTLFGVTKKFFGNKPGVQSPASSLNSVVYGPDAPELQVRKLGDLAFMFQLYEVAYQAYHNAKRDFNADQAWLHFAGASEMAALSVFMQNSSAHEYPMHYMESAITTYLHTCKLPELATRATFLSTECLKSKSLYSEAAIQFVRMPSEADLPSALCLEQAAYCYIHCKVPKMRKFAFHIILAGHRFSKAGQRKHALRSYKQAEQVYRSLGWNFANNHINFTIGRLSVQLDQLESACSAFEPLLVSKCELPADEQANYLKEYLFVLKNAAKELPVLPVPLINSEATKVLLSEDNTACKDESLCVNGRGFDRGDINNNVWNKLEEIVITRISNNAICHNNLHCFSNKTDNTAKPNAIVGEIISIEVVLKNPLSVALTIEDVYPLWVFTPQAETGSDETTPSIKNEPGFNQTHNVTDYIETIVLPQVMIEPRQEKKIQLLITPKQIGELVVTGIAYKLLALKSQDFEQNLDSVSNSPSSTLSLQGKQCFSIRGSRLNRTTEERASEAYAQDNRLNINVLSSMAKLQVNFHSFPYSLFCGEIQKVTAQLTNVGQHKLRRIIMASPKPGLFAIGNPGEVNDSESILKEISSSRQPSPVIAKWEADWMVEVLMSDGEPCILEPGSSLEIPVWFKGPETPGDHALDILFYYETEPPHPKLRYRVLQLSTVLVTYPVVSVQSHAMRSFCPEEKLSSFHPAALPSSLILSVEVANTSEELNQVSLVQISCISKDWCFLPSEDNCRKGLPVIHSEESLMLTLKAIGFDPKVTVSSQKVKVFSHIPMGRVEVDNSSTPCLDFSQKSSLDLSSIVPNDHNPLSLPSVKECDKLRIEQDMILLVVIIWKAKVNRNGEERIVIGLHHVPILSLDPSNVEIKTPSVEAEDIIPENEESEVDQLHSSVPSDLAVTAMLKCSLTHPFQVLHNFSEKRIIVIPVEFVVRSTSDIELTVVIDNLSHLESSGAYNPEDGYGHLVQRFTWVNGTKRELQVKPHSTVQVSLQAMFCMPGTYNLGRLISENIVVTNHAVQHFLYNVSFFAKAISHLNETGGRDFAS
ncbi:Trafficking protein particle complex subunit 8 [Araneus ventricosus]|uniref:Trafficking protein particle complex subunit 8 n=1 Tax=Araneus ventricosus TaxID=182803 RepID=A0A4Y2FMV8_ARAVE|nr:Trafficking protein particle complex subunit 8 [Araneus ventricosus]